MLFGVALAVGAITIGTGVKGGAVAAIVGMLVGLVPGRDDGADVACIRVAVAVGPVAIDRAIGARRVKAKRPQASTPETIATDIRMIEERGILPSLMGQPDLVRAIGINSGAAAAGTWSVCPPLGLTGSGFATGNSRAGVGVLRVTVGRSSLSGGGRVSGGGGGTDNGLSLPLAKNGFLGFGEGGASGSRRRSRVNGSFGGGITGSGMEAGWRGGSTFAGRAGSTGFAGGSLLIDVDPAVARETCGGSRFSSGRRTHGFGADAAVGGEAWGSEVSGRAGGVCVVAVGLCLVGVGGGGDGVVSASYRSSSSCGLTRR